MSSKKEKAKVSQEKRFVLDEMLLKINQSIKLSPKNSDAHFSKGNILSLLGKNLAAIDCYNTAIRINNEIAEYHYNKGVTLNALLLHQDAVLSLARAIEIHPEYAKAHLNLGSIKSSLGEYIEALDCFNKAILIEPDNIDATIGKCQTLNLLKRHTESEKEFGYALGKFPGNRIILENFAAFHIGQKEYAKAEKLLLDLTSLYPDSHEAWRTLGDVQYNLENLPCALASTEKSIFLKKDCADAYYNLGVIYKAQDNQKMAESSFESALLHDQNHKLSHINLAPIYLGQFKFSAGWREYKWRWTSPLCDSSTLNTKNPLWDGSSRNDRLFIWAEQGVGDQILYGSLLQLLENYPGAITVSLDARLIPSFQRSYPKMHFIDQKIPLNDADFDLHTPIAELGSIFVNSVEALDKRSPPFLASNLPLTDAIRNAIKDDKKLICGISWKSINKNIGASKSLSLSALIPVLTNPRFDFINLQHGNVLGEISEIEESIGIKISDVDGLDLFNDIDGLISTIDACDLVITTSNSTAHLAGALNKETYLIIPRTKGRLWYWHDRVGSSPWYPSIKIYTQDQGGSWSGPITQINHELRRKFEN